MSDIANHQQPYGLSHAAAERPARDERQADAPFLRRILFGLIAATIFSGAVSFGLTTQNEIIENMQVASAHGPA